jgi:AsmA family
MTNLRRVVFLAPLVVVAAGLAAPFLNAERYHSRIQAALETAIHRHVEIEKVHLNLFTGPGFTLDNVLISDTQAAGIEPFAHVNRLQARVKFTSLFTGRLAFSYLQFSEPTVNLVRPAEAPWNISPALSDLAPTAKSEQALPDIAIRDARINFKFGDTKSIFYISNADIDLSPNSDGDVVIRFSGDPARTDRSGAGFGRFSARGMLRTAGSMLRKDQLNLGLHLERTSVSDLATLFYGRDIGVHGFAIGSARLSGPLSKLDLSGDLMLDDIHRWDLMPTRAEVWNLKVKGAWNVPGQHLEIETIAPSAVVKFRADGYLTAPHWGALITLNQMPAAAFGDAARHLGAPLPAALQLEGKVSGVIGFDPQSGMDGSLSVDQGSLKLERAGQATFGTLPIVVSGDDVAFGPADLTLPSEQTAAVQGHYSLDGQRLRVRVSSVKLSVADIESGAAPVAGSVAIPVLERLRQGTFRGWIEFGREDQAQPGQWTGSYDVQNALLDVPGMAGPVRIDSATVTVEPAVTRIERIRGRADGVRFEGDYAFTPHTMHLSIGELQLAECERLFLPTLRHNETLLSRLRNTPAPAWLRERNLTGVIHIQKLLQNDVDLGSLNVRLNWNGVQVHLSAQDPRMEGVLAINLAGSMPLYHFSGKLRDVEYRGGTLDLNGDVDTVGLGTALLANAQATGTFSAHTITLGPDGDFREIAGSYRVAGGKLLLQGIEAQQGADTLTGQAATQPDGRLLFELASARKQLRLSATLMP